MTNDQWATRGITWVSGIVSRQHGPNKTDRVPFAQRIQIPHVTDVAKAVAAGLGPAILKGINGTSWRVMAQDVGRSYLEDVLAVAGAKYDVELNRHRVWNRLLSIRSVSVQVVERIITKIQLPNGEVFEGVEGSTEHGAAFIAALVDLGVPADAAREKWAAKHPAVETETTEEEVDEQDDELDELDENVA